MTSGGFYDSFLKLLDIYFEQKLADNSQNGRELRPKPLKNLRDRNDTELLKDSRYRNFLLKQGLPKLEAVKLFADPLMTKVCKPQKLITNDPDYYVAVDLATSTYYVCYRHLLMIDIDLYKDQKDSRPMDTVEGQSNQDGLRQILLGIREYCQKYSQLRFRVFRSNGGIHLFAVNRGYDYKDDSTLQLMLDLGCDFYYIVYSYVRGYSVRLNPKTVEGPELRESNAGENIRKKKLYKELDPIGDGPVDPHLNKLVDLHLDLCEVFKDVQPSMMFGKAM